MFNYRQPCNWNSVSVVMTILLFAMWGAIPFLHQRYVTHDFALDIVAVLIFLCFVCGLYFCPKYVEVSNSLLTIGKLISKKIIPLADIASVTPYQRTMNFVRTIGSGGFMGYWGHYRNQELGKFFVYATRMDQLILVTLKSGKKYVISCKNADEMCEQINLRLSKTASSTTQPETSAS